MFEEEMWPVYYVRPKEQAYDGAELREVPESLVKHYKIISEEFSLMQKELKKIWEGE